MRKTKLITIPGIHSEEQGMRDNGKTFLITEMAAKPAEKWADRAFLALARSRADLPPDAVSAGMAGLAEIAHVVGNIRFPDLEPLMDELMTCVQFVWDQKTHSVRPLVDNGSEADDIEEPTTRYLIRSEVIALHTNFSVAAAIFNLIAVASTMTTLISETTSTSRRRSRRSSRAA